MTKSEIREILLVEAHRILNEEAKRVVQKIGNPVPEEARPGYLTEEDISILKQIGPAQLDHPVVQKSMRAGVQRTKVLSYPLKEVLSSEELDALEGLRLSAAERDVVERLVAEACSATLFHFFCLMDSVADPELVKVENWSGADFVSPREEGDFLHDEFLDRYWAYEKLSAV
jgi:hypothetical protein